MLRGAMTLIANFLLVSSVFAASNGTNGTATATVSKSAATIGEQITLTVNVSGITAKSGAGSDGKCNYSITIPAGLTPDGGTAKTNDLSGTSGNGDKSHGSYTTSTVGCYTFELSVSTGSKNGDNPTVCFYPKAPIATDATDLTPISFTANWNTESSASSYVVTLTKEGEGVVTEYEVNGTSYAFSGLSGSTQYYYTVKSKTNGMLSLSSSNSIPVLTPVAPVISTDGAITPYSSFINETASQYITVNGLHLMSDISLSILENDSPFSIDKATITQDDIDNSENVIQVSFSSTIAGNYNATLKISTLYAQDILIPLSGICSVPTPVATEATNPKSSGFTANWEEIEGATYYLLTVKDFADMVVDGYNELNVGNVTFFNVRNLQAENDYSYTVKAGNNNIASSSSNIINTSTIAGPVITYTQFTPISILINTSASKTIRIAGSRLEDIINIDISGSEYFSIDKDELGIEGGSVKVTYSPTVTGVHTAQLILNSEGIDEITINLQGNSLPVATTALPATNAGLNTFTANWEVYDENIEYVLTIKLGNNTVFENTFAGTINSHQVPGLTSGSVYTYTVAAKTEGLLSEVSNEITAITHSVPQPSTTAANATSIRTDWTELPSANSYTVSLFKDGSVVPGFDQVSVSETGFSFTGLDRSTAYTYQVTAWFGTEFYASNLINASTTNVNGNQINNLGFELWDDLGQKAEEPTSWNSFIHAGGSLSGAVNGTQKVKRSTVGRPGTNGSYSALFWSTATMGIIANGNMTTGQIQANSMTASDASNHNITKRSDAGFNQRLGGKPDSLTVWVKYVPKNATPTKGSNTARISATIHDDYDYRDPADAAASNHVVATAIQNYSAANGNGWQRLSVPFEYTGPATLPDYILVSFTTNQKPGEGTAGDSVYVDDMLMVYKPILAIGNINKAKYLHGEKLTLPYTLTGSMSVYNLDKEVNKVILEISDKNGDFTNARILSEIVTDQSGTLSATLPDDLEYGTGYKVRVVTTNYPMTSNPGAAFEIRSMPAIPVALDATNETAASFVANWEAVEGATGYILVTNGNAFVISDGNTTSYTVKNLIPETTYTYTVKAVKDDLISGASNIIQVTTTDGGVINYEGDAVFATDVNVSDDHTFIISGMGLINKVTPILPAGSAFSVKAGADELTTDGGELIISYKPTTLGEHSATLTLRSTFADDVRVTLTGTSILAPPTMTTAKNVGPTAFTAQWDAPYLVDAYLLTITDSEGNIVGNYDDLNVGTVTSLDITDLTPETTYTYSAKTVYNGETSRVSNAIEATTIAVPELTCPDAENPVVFDVVFGNTDQTTITYSILNPAGLVAISYDNSNVNFSVVERENEFDIVYDPAGIGTHTFTITLSSPYVTDIVINVTGTSRPAAVIALDAGDITPVSFTAQWEESTEADAYLLTVKDNEGNVVEGYDELEVNSTSYNVSALAGSTTYTYTVTVLTGTTTSAISNEITVTTLATPVINCPDAENTIVFDIATGNSDSETITYSIDNALGDVSLAYDDTDINFSIVEGEDEFEIIYNPTAIGTYAFTITLSSPYAPNVVVNVTGISRPDAVIALDATGVTPASFIAHWEESTDAGAYLLTVKDNEGNMVEGYDELEVNTTSYNVSSLAGNTAYTYTVKVLAGITTSVASNEISVTTSVTPVINCPDAENIIAFDVTAGDNWNTETVTYSITNALGDVSLTYDDTDVDFTIVEGEDEFDITYNPTSIGTHTFTITLSSPYATDIVVNITGINRPVPVTALTEINVTPYSFTAQWSEAANPDAYLLTVKDSDGNILEGYDDLEVYTTSYDMTSLASNADYSYTVKVLVGTTTSVVSNEVVATTAIIPVIYCPKAENAIAFEIIFGNSDLERVIYSIDNALGNIGLTYDDADVNFSVVERENEFDIVYDPANIGAHTFTVTLSSPYATNVVVNVTGTSRPEEIMALDATEISAFSFVANWTASADADAYLLTVKDNEGNIVDGYNGLNVGNVTTYEITGLTEQTNYSYVVTVVSNNISSDPSNEKYLTTLENQDVGFDGVTSPSVAVYPNPVSERLYIENIVAEKATIYSYNGSKIAMVQLTSNSINVSRLPEGLYVIVLETKNKEVYKTSFIKK